MSNSNGSQKDLREWDLILVSSSAGKDSQAMLDLVARMAKDQGVLDRVHVVHAELEEEWAGTKELVKEQADHYGVPTHYTKRLQGSLLDQVEKRGMWPGVGPKQRYCTSDHKRGPINRVITRLADEARERIGRKQIRVLSCQGLRADESRSRAKRINQRGSFFKDEMGSSGRKDVWIWYPIHDMNTEQVWQMVKDSGVRHHWAYDAGMPRLSCCFCIFAPKAALVKAGQLNPELLNRYVEVEKKIGHTFRKELSMVEVQQAVVAGEQGGQVCNWEMD